MTTDLEQNTVAVVGAGIMGTGIVHGFAVAGANVLIVDANTDASHKAMSDIRTILEGAVERRKISTEDAGAAFGKIEIVDDLAEASSRSGLIVETASENISIKAKIFEVVDDAAPQGAIVATNTSALSVTELAAMTDRARQVAGMHFFNPVHKMKLVELIRGLETADDTIQTLTDWALRMGKQHIVVSEAPGFTTSRMSAMLGNEAMYMLQEGVASAEDIDKALRLGLGHPMGPLELGDMTGWDTRLSVIKYLHSTLGEKFRPCPLIEKMVKSGRYGRKVGKGVYHYNGGKKVEGSGLKP